MGKGIKNKIADICETIRFRRKLRKMDALWDRCGGSSYGLFPPSFYYTHSEEEIMRIKQEEIGKLKERINDFVRQREGRI